MTLGLGASISLAMILLIINGFFVAAEFALVKAQKYKFEQLAREGHWLAPRTLGLYDNLEGYLAACQLGITMASLGLGWIGEPVVSSLIEPLLHPLGLSESVIRSAGFIIGFIIFSSLHIVVGEQVPKIIAIQKPIPVSLWIAYPLHFFYLAILPLNWLLQKSTRTILNVFEIPVKDHSEVFSQEEIKLMVQKSSKHGHLETGTAEVIHNLLEFDERRVDMIMLPKGEVDTLDLSQSDEENLKILKNTQHSRYPILDKATRKVQGVILKRDLFQESLKGTAVTNALLKKVTRKPLYVPENYKISLLFDDMRASNTHMACIIDEYGEFTGVVTLEDVLEEIVGEISDESDLTKVLITEKDGSWEAHGLTPLVDVARTIGIPFRRKSYTNTLSGLFMQKLERIPVVGDKIQHENYELEVIETANHHVEKVIIKKSNEHPDD